METLGAIALIGFFLGLLVLSIRFNKHWLRANAEKAALNPFPDSARDGTAASGATVISSIQDGGTEALQRLLQLGADPNVCAANGWTATMLAASLGRAEVLRLLIRAKADINQKTEEGWTALHLAVLSQQIKAVRVLVIEGAVDINIITPDGTTPLDIARLRDETKIVKFLEAAGGF